MLRRAIPVVALLASSLTLAGPGCSKNADDGARPSTSTAADAPPPGGGGGGQAMPEGGGGEAPPSPDEKRRGRRGIETDVSAKATALFADAPAPPPFDAAANQGPGAKGPAPVAMPADAKRTSRIALLAHHLQAMRKLRAGLLSDKTSITVYDAGHKRVTYDRAALLKGDGRWLSARLVGVVPKPDAAALDGAVGTITAASLGWRVIYVYVDNRWRLSEVWRDRP